MRRAIAVLAASVLGACGDQPPQPRVGSQPVASGGTSSAATPPNTAETQPKN